MTKQTIIGPDGEHVEIDAALFKASKDEAFEYLREIDNHQTSFKEVVETVSETTGLTKGYVSKYFKASFKSETEKAKQLGDSFASLDEAVA